MDVDVSALMSSLGRSETFEYFACVVFLGVAGEIVADFTRIIKNKSCKRKFALLSAITLLVGIGGELAGPIKVSILTGKIIFALEGETLLAASLALLKMPTNLPYTADYWAICLYFATATRHPVGSQYRCGQLALNKAAPLREEF
jgi:hypothetical protein